MVQPVARLYGRFRNGLTPWRKRGAGTNFRFLFGLRTHVFTHWSEEWRSAESWLQSIEKNVKSLRARVKQGNDFSRWDIQVRNGLFIRTNGLLTIEEHGGGKQLIRFRCTPHYTIRV